MSPSVFNNTHICFVTDSGRKHVVVTCLDCGLKKRYRTDNSDYRLWSERREAWVVQPRGIINETREAAVEYNGGTSDKINDTVAECNNRS